MSPQTGIHPYNNATQPYRNVLIVKPDGVSGTTTSVKGGSARQMRDGWFCKIGRPVSCQDLNETRRPSERMRREGLLVEQRQENEGPARRRVLLSMPLC